MAATTSIPASVQKELIPYLHFPKDDVLHSDKERRERLEKLDKATVIGNLDHTKVAIIFEDVHGLKRVETTIWATTEENIVLKQGAVIPIHRIHDVEFV
ncbi:MAG TPA: hypothetical protein VNJ07_03745 [Chitinophagales bacterium]|nr:hypothetical protein [Chitinophagales bacterium]